MGIIEKISHAFEVTLRQLAPTYISEKPCHFDPALQQADAGRNLGAADLTEGNLQVLTGHQ